MDTDLGATRVRYVRVNNHLDRPFTDRFDGVPVTIEAGSWDNLPLDMAAHFFGYDDGVDREQMFRHICKRQGWNTIEYLKVDPKTGKNLAQQMFDRLEIKPVVFRMVEETPDTDAPIPADPQLEELPNPIRRKAQS